MITGLSCQLARPTGAPLLSRRVRDGIYLGKSRSGLNSATVRVFIQGGRIRRVEVVKHVASWKGKRVIKIIPRRIVAEQSTAVDAVSGATNSSVVLMNAVQNAVEKAYDASLPQP